MTLGSCHTILYAYRTYIILEHCDDVAWISFSNVVALSNYYVRILRSIPDMIFQ